MYGDILQRDFGKARMEAYLDEAEIRRLKAACKAKETTQSLPRIIVAKSSFQRFLDGLFRRNEGVADARKGI
jgi:hypothetical protein